MNHPSDIKLMFGTTKQPGMDSDIERDSTVNEFLGIFKAVSDQFKYTEKCRLYY